MTRIRAIVLDPPGIRLVLDPAGEVFLTEERAKALGLLRKVSWSDMVLALRPGLEIGGPKERKALR